ncbi:hypothetical protein FH972_011179 [Carpinus fangiana]|uniref:Uncharacterized protein n=1 Tax=Carpinus fangiana TaxID=176857 RepID=A0A660KSK9_9ROSI|nr:hypothetical protein FH972_011179 [Carpinus fangiana]
MSPLRTGVTFALGTMCGIFIARGYQFQRSHHNHEARRNWPCPRDAGGKKTTAGPEVEETTKTIPNN